MIKSLKCIRLWSNLMLLTIAKLPMKFLKIRNCGISDAGLDLVELDASDNKKITNCARRR